MQQVLKSYRTSFEICFYCTGTLYKYSTRIYYITGTPLLNTGTVYLLLLLCRLYQLQSTGCALKLIKRCMVFIITYMYLYSISKFS